MNSEPVSAPCATTTDKWRQLVRAQAATCEWLWTKSATLALASLQRPIERNESDLVRIWMGFRRRASSSTCCAFAAAAIADVSARAQINRPISARRHSNQSSRRPGARRTGTSKQLCSPDNSGLDKRSRRRRRRRRPRARCAPHCCVTSCA